MENNIPEIHIHENQQITGVVVISTLYDFTTGQTTLNINSSDDVNWIMQRGMLETALSIIKETGFVEDSEGEEDI